MATLQELRDKRANTWENMKEVMDSATDDGLDAQATEKYDRLEAAFDKLDADITRQEKHEARAVNLSKVDRSGVVAPDGLSAADSADVEAVYNDAFKIFLRNGMLDLDSDQRAALRAGYVKVDGKEIRAAGGVGSGTGGGYLVPTGFRDLIIEKQKAFGAVQEVATVITTNTGNPLPWATNDDTGNVGALLAENTAAAEQDLVYGTAQLGAYKYTSKLIRESIEFLQDVDWTNIEEFLSRKLAERLARIHNQHFTTGSGTGQPQGIVTGASGGVTAASATAFTADELIDLQHSIDPAYRNERSQFMLSDTALKAARKLKDSQGRYLFQTSTSGDVPSLLAGSRYVVNQDMAVPATGVKSVLYGDFLAGYVVRRVKNLELLRLAERYAEYGQVGFIAFDRMDGLVQDTSAFKALVQA